MDITEGSVQKDKNGNGSVVKIPILRVLTIIVSVLSLVGVAFGGYVISRQEKIINGQIVMKERLSTIESNRFTSADGLAVWKQIGIIQASLEKVPKEVPPAWFKDRVDLLENKVDVLGSKIARLEERVDHILVILSEKNK